MSDIIGHMQTMFGLYPDAVDMAIETAASILVGGHAVIQEYDEPAEADSLDVDLFEISESAIKENLDTDDMTNSIITTVFDILKTRLEEKLLFSVLGVSFSYYVNCHDSHFYMDINRAGTHKTVRLTSDGDMVDNINYILAEEIVRICKLDPDYEDSVFQSIVNMDIEAEDIVACVFDNEHIIQDSLRTLLEELKEE